MNRGVLDRRLAALEAARVAAPVRLTPEELDEAARRYEATLHEDAPSSPEAAAYCATATLHQLTADYEAMQKGAPAPWE
jgi:hypothetical protein